MKIIFTIFFACLQMITYAQITQIDIVSTLHKNHLQNPNYTYEDVKKYLEDEKPDIIALEIRAEDMNLSKEILAKRYPFEMYDNLYKISNVSYIGIDWYGDDIVGKPFPDNYFDNENSVKNVQMKMNKDADFSTKLSVLKPLTAKKFELVKKLNIHEMKNGMYDAINEVYYQQIELLCKNSPYEMVSKFYETRDLRLAENTSEIIEQNLGKKIIVLTGADHRIAMVKYLNSRFGQKIQIKP